jgi:hypothetical protein
MNVVDLLELLGYILAFWAFVFSPQVRGKALRAWNDAGPGHRCGMLLQSIIAATCGLGAPAVVLAAGLR